MFLQFKIFFAISNFLIFCIVKFTERKIVNLLWNLRLLLKFDMFVERFVLLIKFYIYVVFQLKSCIWTIILNFASLKDEENEIEKFITKTKCLNLGHLRMGRLFDQICFYISVIFKAFLIIFWFFWLFKCQKPLLWSFRLRKNSYLLVLLANIFELEIEIRTLLFWRV